jgi:hypothetical protein
MLLTQIVKFSEESRSESDVPRVPDCQYTIDGIDKVGRLEDNTNR